MARKKRKTVLRNPSPGYIAGGTCTCTLCGAQAQVSDAAACEWWISQHRENCSADGESICRGLDHENTSVEVLTEFKPSGLAKSKAKPKK